MVFMKLSIISNLKPFKKNVKSKLTDDLTLFSSMIFSSLAVCLASFMLTVSSFVSAEVIKRFSTLKSKSLIKSYSKKWLSYLLQLWAIICIVVLLLLIVSLRSAYSKNVLKNVLKLGNTSTFIFPLSFQPIATLYVTFLYWVGFFLPSILLYANVSISQYSVNVFCPLCCCIAFNNTCDTTFNIYHYNMC